MSWPPTVRVALASRADNVALIREVLGGLDEIVALGDALDDIKTAVSEACNNVVMHAYDGREGPLEVDLRVLDHALEVVVRDEGVGILPREPPAGSELTRGLGLAVIDALADSVDLRLREPHGVELVMRFDRPPGTRAATAPSVPATFDWPAPPDGAVQISLAPASLSKAVLARVLCATAARSGFSIDRLSDAQLVADALAADLEPVLAGEAMALSVEGGRRRIELELGPLQAGSSRGALAGTAIGALGGVIERLTDEVEIHAVGPVERMRLVMIDQSRG
jgi:anti-sigma regulatory factor (Ser/Thr protein kinase)